MIHKNGDKMPPCGHPMGTEHVNVFSLVLMRAFLSKKRLSIISNRYSGHPFLLSADRTAMGQVQSNATLTSKKTTAVYCLFLKFVSIMLARLTFQP